MRRWRYVAVGLLGLLVTCTAAALQKFVRQPSDQYVRLGQTVVLPCQVANPVGQVQWTRDEFGLGIIRDLPSYPRYQMIGDDHEGIFSLEVQRVALEDDAEFQCQVGAAAGVPGIRSRTARLTVLVPPEPPRIDEGRQLLTSAKSVVRLHCESRGGKPPAEIEWYDGDRELIENNSETHVSMMSDGKRSVVRSTLTLTVAPRHHRTNVTCRAHNSALSAPQTAALRLVVRFAPLVTLRASRQRVVEGRDVTFTCAATANPEPVDYRWFVNGKEQPDSNVDTLTLKSVGRGLNNATVRCRVSNDVGTTSGHSRIAVLYAPRFRHEPEDVAADAGHEVSLNCDVDANPEPRVTWVKRDCQSCQRRVGEGRRLRLRATRQTVGRYECRASADGFPAVSRQLMLFVRAQPDVSARATQRGVLGKTVHVECVVASVPPPHTVTWYFRQAPVSTEMSRYKVVEEPVVGGSRSLLVISDAVDSDFGLYNCSFVNAYGSDSALVILQKQRALPLPVILIIVVSAIVVVAALILVVIMCQRRRRRASDKPNGHVTRDKLGGEAEPNSSGSDLKVDIRTASLGSGQVISDRWDGSGHVADDCWDGGAREPAQRRLYREPAEANGFPPFNKEASSPAAVVAYPRYDGYVRPPGPAAPRALYASSPSTADEYGGYAGYGDYAGAPGQDAKYVVDSQLKPGTLATHV